MSHYKLTSAFAAGSILLAQLLAYGPVLAQTSELVKVKDNSAVYLISGTTRKAFPLLSVYESWYGLDFSSVKTISSEELAKYFLNKNVLFKPGSLIKIQTDPKVYHVLNESGALEWIPSEAEFIKRGFSFKNVKDVPDSLFSDYYHANSSDFATPQNPQSETPTSTNTSNLGTQKPNISGLEISSVEVSSFAGVDGSAQARFAFTTNREASIKIELVPNGYATTTLMIDTNTTFNKMSPVFAGFSYKYFVTATAADGQVAQKSGTFVSYSDVTEKAITNLVPPNALLNQNKILVGGFSMQNNSSVTKVANLFGIRFDSSSSVTSAPSKTLQIVRLNADNTAGAVIAEKNIPAGTAITNSNSIQNISVEETLAPGESRRYGIILINVDQVNLSLVSPTDTFVPFVSRIDFTNDTSLNLDLTPLATFLYYK